MHGEGPERSTHVADVAEYGNHSVLVFRQSDGASVRRIGRADCESGTAPGEFHGPIAVAAAHGRLYVSEHLGRRIQVLSVEGKPLQILPTPFFNHRLCVDGDLVWVLVSEDSSIDPEILDVEETGSHVQLLTVASG